jgi:hypothetical protein
MPNYVLDVDGVKYNISTRVAPKREYHMTATVAEATAKVTPIDHLSADEQEALRYAIRVLKHDPPKF